MALTACRECQREVSTAAKTCPHCGIGRPGAQQVSWRVALLIVAIVAVGLIWVESPGTAGGHPTMDPQLQGELASAKNATPPPPPPPPPPKTDHWEVRRTSSAMDGSSGFVLGLDATGEIDGWLDHSTPRLIVRCKENKTDVYVHTGLDPQPELGEYDEVTVRTRYDDHAPSESQWDESTDQKSLFAPAPIDVAQRLANAKTFRFQFTPFNAVPAIATFDVRGLGAHLADVAKACHWQP